MTSSCLSIKKIGRISSLLLFILAIPLSGEIVSLTFETARSPNELSWGLMGRKSLPKDHGMLFIYPENNYHSLWMFNTWIDLSVAFLDVNGVIVEIHELQSHPEWMDPSRPIQGIRDLLLYPYNDPIIQAFTKNRLDSSRPIKFALEMNKGWFAKHGITIGDQLVLTPNLSESYISKKTKTHYDTNEQ